MPKTRKEKEKIVENLKDDLTKSYGLICLSFSQIPNNDLVVLRKEIKDLQGSARVVKKRLFQIAWQDSKKEESFVLPKEKKGNLLSLFIFQEDSLLPILKLVNSFRKKFKEEVEVIAGWLENRIYSEKEIVSLAEIPSKEVLLTRLVYSLKSPLNSLVYSLKGEIFKLIFVLEKIKQGR